MAAINEVIENPLKGINTSERKYKVFVSWIFNPNEESYFSSDSKYELEGIVKNRIKNKDILN